jgi:hypothetical protein
MGPQVLVAVVAVVAAASVLLAVVALASWVRALAVTAEPPAALAAQVVGVAEGLVVQTEYTMVVEFTVGVLELLTLARVVVAPSVLFGPAQTYPLARSHQQTQGMYK